MVACLISPVTWIHHLVWLLPALVAVADAGLRLQRRRHRYTALALAAGGYAILASGLIWLWRIAPTPMTGIPSVGAFLCRNFYIWIILALFLGVVARSAGPGSGDRTTRTATRPDARI